MPLLSWSRLRCSGVWGWFLGWLLFSFVPLLAAEPTGVVGGGATVVTLEAVGPPSPELVERLQLDPRYVKSMVVGGFPIVASQGVPDAAVAEAGWLITRMLAGREDLLRALAANRVRFVVMSHEELTTDIPEHSDLRPRDYWDRRARGLGASRARPAVSCGAENLLGYPGDPYASECILVHEFGHAIHELGLCDVDPTFDPRLKLAYEQALAAGLWQGKYAATNRAEYWAEGVQSWFDTNREDDHDHNHVNTREELKEYDPGLARLLIEVFGDGPWRYTRAITRRELPHLAAWDPATNPTFAWPAEVSQRYRAFQRAASGEPLEPGDRAWVETPLESAAGLAERRSPRSTEGTRLLVVNRRAGPVTVEWIDFEGRLRPQGNAPSGKHLLIETYVSHAFLVRADGEPVGIIAASSQPGRVIIPREGGTPPPE